MENIDLKEVGRLDDSFVEMAQQRYQAAKDKSVNKTKQKINGELYVGRTFKCQQIQAKAKNAMILVAIAATVGTIGYISSVANTLDSYDLAVNEAEGNLPFSNFSDKRKYNEYKKENEPNVLEKITEAKETLNEISEEKDKLKETNNYSFFDINKLTDDAIQNVANDHVNNLYMESKENSGGMHYGK